MGMHKHAYKHLSALMTADAHFMSLYLLNNSPCNSHQLSEQKDMQMSVLLLIWAKKTTTKKQLTNIPSYFIQGAVWVSHWAVSVNRKQLCKVLYNAYKLNSYRIHQVADMIMTEHKTQK